MRIVIYYIQEHVLVTNYFKLAGCVLLVLVGKFLLDLANPVISSNVFT